MAELPIGITLVGHRTTNPAIPSENIEGTLTITHSNLKFRSGNCVHKIPLEHIDKIETVFQRESFGEEWRILLSLFFSGAIILATAGLGLIPLIWYFWWENTSITVCIVITAWDEEYGLNATTVFSLGNKRKHRDEVYDLIQEIWDVRGIVRAEINSRSSVIYREEEA